MRRAARRASSTAPRPWLLWLVLFVCCVGPQSADAYTELLDVFAASLFPGNARLSACGAGETSHAAGHECFCDMGFSGAAGACAMCVSGSFQNTVNSGTCNDCPGFSVSLLGARTPSECLCVAGRWKVGDACELCAVDTYKGFAGVGPCLSCYPNSVSGSGSTLLSECLCAAGYTVDNGGDFDSRCVSCGTAHYKTASGDGVCTPCHGNSHVLGGDVTPGTALSACVCDAGFFGTSGAGSCTQCALGEYKVAAADTACLPCGALETTAALGSTAEAECVCQKGAGFSGGACSACEAGYAKAAIGDDACTVCAAGSWSDAGAEACSSCPGNSQRLEGSIGAGIASCECLAGYERDGDGCVPCDAGDFKAGVGNDVLCSNCGTNTYQELTGKSSCSGCPEFSQSPAGSFSPDQCLCDAGRHLDGEVCEECLTGSSKSSAGNGPCTTCEQGTYSASTTSCQACPHAQMTTLAPGATDASFCVCNAGFDRNGDLCDDCPPNSFCPSAGVKTACFANTHSDAGSTAVAQCTCNAGFWRDSEESCADCPVDHFCVEDEKHDCFGNSGAVAGSSQEDQCTCSPGYERNDV